jgi:S-formylglutathione hydrolase FrmB
VGGWRLLALATALVAGVGFSTVSMNARVPAMTSVRGAVTEAAQALRVVHDLAPWVPHSPKGIVETHTFWSASLARPMPYQIYLPPGYADSTRRYPVVYLLHGMAGSDRQWQDLGIATVADRLIATGTIAPLIIVMPEGGNAYWVDHATDGQRWGSYTAVDVVNDVDATYRTIARQRSRAIGGLSMGAHGALQLALNNPGVFTAVGAHSLVLRRFNNAPAYFGTAADFAKRDPVQIVKSVGAAGCSFSLWIDIGEADPWVANAEQFNAQLADLGVKHQWHLWAGDHSDAYWSAHLDDYLRFYDASLSSRVPRSTAF